MIKIEQTWCNLCEWCDIVVTLYFLKLQMINYIKIYKEQNYGFLGINKHGKIIRMNITPNSQLEQML